MLSITKSPSSFHVSFVRSENSFISSTVAPSISFIRFFTSSSDQTFITSLITISVNVFISYESAITVTLTRDSYSPAEILSENSGEISIIPCALSVARLFMASSYVVTRNSKPSSLVSISASLSPHIPVSLLTISTLIPLVLSALLYREI